MASKLLGTYDPSKVSFTLSILGTSATAIPLVGFPEGEMVTVEKNEENFNNSVGTQGEVVRAANRNLTGNFTIRLFAQSPSVKYLEGLMTTESIMQAGGIGVSPVLTFKVVDPSSQAAIFASQCWLQKVPTYSWSNDASVLEYNFFAVNVTTAPNENLSILQNVANTLGLL